MEILKIKKGTNTNIMTNKNVTTSANVKNKAKDIDKVNYVTKSIGAFGLLQLIYIVIGSSTRSICTAIMQLLKLLLTDTCEEYEFTNASL